MDMPPMLPQPGASRLLRVDDTGQQSSGAREVAALERDVVNLLAVTSPDRSPLGRLHL